MENEDKKLITEIQVGPALSCLIFVWLVCSSNLSGGELLGGGFLIVFLWRLGDVIVIDWRKLFRRS